MRPPPGRPRIEAAASLWGIRQAEEARRRTGRKPHKPGARLGLVRLVAPVPVHPLRNLLGVEVQVKVLAAVQERAKLHLWSRTQHTQSSP